MKILLLSTVAHTNQGQAKIFHFCPCGMCCIIETSGCHRCVGLGKIKAVKKEKEASPLNLKINLVFYLIFLKWMSNILDSSF